MSHYMTALAMKQTGLKPAVKIVLYWLADHYNQSTGECFPSHKRLAELCEMTDRSVRLHLDQLAEAGLISVVKRTRDNGSQTSNSYHLKMRTGDDGRKIFPTPSENISTPPVQIFPTLNPVNNNHVNEPEELRGAKAQKQRKPEIDLPEGWIPSDKNVQDAIDRGFTAQEIEDEADRFRNYHRSKQNRYRDWDAAWRTWLGNARKYRTSDRGKGGQGSGMAAAFASAAADIVARKRNSKADPADVNDSSGWGVDAC